MVPKDGLNLYMAGVEGWVLPERELSTTHTHTDQIRVINKELTESHVVVESILSSPQNTIYGPVCTF